MNMHVQFGFNNICSFWEEGICVSKRFFSETTGTIETKLPRNDHWKVLYKVLIFYADRKSKMCPSGFREEAFWGTFPIGSNVKLSPAVAAILNFISEQKT
jgi:hypothetical protein